ncbi:hypothetical protein JCM24511_01430 [Saitozyma sp. JCM 24511]|nr:hypothetical protein JCM24511_01430 [Saitozyma sp. JCM 24511]
MPIATNPPSTDIAPGDMTGDQLALASSEKVFAQTRYGKITGGRVRNGCQVFLNVPYGQDVPRWADPKPLADGHRYPGKEYTVDGLYCAQPSRSYTLQIPMRDRLGLGQPTENPFFADIYIPSDRDLSDTSLPPLSVRVFIHGGFLQFGSTSGQHYNQQFFSSEHFNEIRVLLGHRVSVLGFLGCDEPKVSGNFGFKDCWLGLEWVRDSIAAFGGDPEQVHLSGLSGGGHVVHQLLHHAARLAPSKAPFVTATLMSNAILTDPLPPSSRRDQFAAFCRALGADPSSPAILEELRDTTRYPTAKLIEAVQAMGGLSTFRGVVGDDGWNRADEMAYQQSGGLAAGLKAAGVKCVIMGDVRDEDYFYSIVHPCQSAADVLPNLERYYTAEASRALRSAYPDLPADASPAECDRLQGRILSDGQVHLPVRLLAKDLVGGGMPVVRYAIEYVAANLGTKGHVSHGTDLALQHLRLSVLSPEETLAALGWLRALDEAVRPALEGRGEAFVQHEEEEMLVLAKDGSTAWRQDWRWSQLRAAEAALRG